ncbi:hypothetical protein ZWY2020_043117 [Hordeum vulgare]|nr:hypothetical protein ZWY2020_043117 [Hordeum vulgare]
MESGGLDDIVNPLDLVIVSSCIDWGWSRRHSTPWRAVEAHGDLRGPGTRVACVGTEATITSNEDVKLPKHVSDKRHFCGTALVEFSEEYEANNIMNNKLSFAGADLEIKTKKEFDAEMEAKKEAYEKSHPNTHPNKNGHDEGYPKGLILAFKLKKILADGDTEQNGGDKVDNTVSANKEGASESAEESGKASEEKALRTLMPRKRSQMMLRS